MGRDGERRDVAQDRVLVIQREFEHTLGLVRDVGNFVEPSRWVGRREFRKFVNPALKRHGNIQALQWVPRVTAAERDAFVSKARRSFTRFRITQRDDQGQLVGAEPRSEYFPILYVQPYQLNKEALGFDLASDPRELQSLLTAAAAGEMQVSPPVSFSRDGIEQFSFVARIPVYYTDSIASQGGAMTSDQPADTAKLQTQRPLLRGFAIGKFRIGDVVEQALVPLTPGGIDMRIYDTSSGDERQLLYHHASRMRAQWQHTLEEDANSIEDSWKFTGTLKVANQQWTIVCNPIAGYFQADPWNGWVILAGGLAFTFLLTIYLTTQVGQAAKVRRLVDERTEQLMESNAALVNEVAARKLTEQKLQELNETLEQRVALRTALAERRAKELEQFAYVASHDLKAPLRAIGNLTSWLEEDLTGKLTKETSEQLTLLKDRVERMQALIEGLLKYSRVGAMESSKETVDTAQLLAETIDSLSPPEGFVIDVPPDMPTLRTDRLQLSQVFANLIGNSIKHHGSKQGHVWIKARDDGEYYEFSVADDGPGIAPEYHKKAFMMFQTLATKDFESDTGIGLALVKKIVQEQGGLISLVSEEGKGSTFRFTWPKEV